MTTLTHDSTLSKTFAPGQPVSGTGDLAVGRTKPGAMFVASIGTDGSAWLLMPTDAQGGWAQHDLSASLPAGKATHLALAERAPGSTRS